MGEALEGGRRADTETARPALEEGIEHHRAGRLAEAETIYRRILADDRDEVSACYLLGVVACQTGRFGEGLELSDRALLQQPKIAHIWSNRGVALRGLGRNAEAIESFSNAIGLQPDFVESLWGRAETLFLLGRHAEAIADCDRAIALLPAYPEVYNCKGNALHAQGREDEALAAYGTAIRFRPNYAEAWCNQGIVLYALGRFEASTASCEEAILLRPEMAEGYFCRGNAQRSMGRNDAALESYGHAIRLKPEFADAYVNRGITLEALSFAEQALADYERALQFDANHAMAWNNRAAILHLMMRYAESLACCDKAIELKPDFPEAHSNRANAQLVLGNYYGALQSCDTALGYRADCEWLRGTRLYLRRFLCDWAGIEAETAEMAAAIERGERATTPFVVAVTCDSPALLRKAAEIYAGNKFPAIERTATFSRRSDREKIRIGYFSSDFREHATSYLMAEVFEQHDRGQFEIFGFSYGLDTGDAMARRVASGMDRFFDVRGRTDKEAAAMAREAGVDIAVDLKGLTGESRTGIFAQRAAPIQVNYLGYPGTMGAAYMDYVIADRTVIPERSLKDYSERVVWLPDSYQPNDSKRRISDRPCTRATEGLPERGFVFCCFNHACKNSPAVFDVWMRILKSVPESVLWMLEDNHWAMENLRKEALRRGVAEERLIFSPSMPLAEHLARLRLADLFLDTFPYGAHTTASDALWAGVPLLTRTGESFASRVGASLLHALRLPELITATEAEFEEMAVKLAQDEARLQGLRQRLAKNRLTSSLFDGGVMARHLETAYRAMIRRYEGGLEPEHIEL